MWVHTSIFSLADDDSLSIGSPFISSTPIEVTEQIISEMNGDEQIISEMNGDEQIISETNGDEQIISETNGDQQIISETNGDEQIISEMNSDEQIIIPSTSTIENTRSSPKSEGKKRKHTLDDELLQFLNLAAAREGRNLLININKTPLLLYSNHDIA